MIVLRRWNDKQNGDRSVITRRREVAAPFSPSDQIWNNNQIIILKTIQN